MNKKMYRQFDNESIDSKGNNLEQVYADLLGGEVTGGINDEGVDIFLKEINKYDISVVQVKSSQIEARKFLLESIKRNEFIPILVGDPGRYTKDEILKSLHENGAWIGFDEDNRQGFMNNVRVVREHILKNGGNLKF
jgi:hypothetical protein